MQKDFFDSIGQTRTSSLGAARPLPPSADIGPGGQSVGQAAQFLATKGRRADWWTAVMRGLLIGVIAFSSTE